MVKFENSSIAFSDDEVESTTQKVADVSTEHVKPVVLEQITPIQDTPQNQPTAVGSVPSTKETIRKPTKTPTRKPTKQTNKQEKATSENGTTTTLTHEKPQAISNRALCLSSYLEKLKTVEPIKDPFSVTYPQPWKGIDTRLKSDAKKYRYDEDFLMQFSNVIDYTTDDDWNQNLETLGCIVGRRRGSHLIRNSSKVNGIIE